ncbi:protein TRIGALACTOSYLDIACYLGLYCEROL 4, chloroplastic [Ziziphus jujuba]|uniref:Protein TRIGALACTOSYLDIACYLGLYCEROL 4, chloroplastic n=1 Tax=Ziziphus jujuba TaxID=326968 RepID=A0A6P4AT24_ZIZJJ|nr:protein TRIGALACTOSYLDIACYLGLYCEROL 4, chloroplastic [Ziziphus jujuba]
MRKLRWVMDGSGFWEVDASTPRTLEAQARAVPSDPLPLGLSRGTRLSRPKQIDFMQRFMAAPFVPFYAGNTSNGGTGWALQRVLTIPFSNNWFGTVLGQFNVQKLLSLVMSSREAARSETPWLQSITGHLKDKSLYAVGFFSELLLTNDDTLLVSFDTYAADNNKSRKKAVFHHKFPHHNLTVEAAWPGLFVDKLGNYWDVPFSVAVDLASVASDSGESYHLCMHHNSGFPEQFGGDQSNQVPTTLLPGFSVKSAFSFKKNIDIWRSKDQKLKMVQPFDIFLSNPQISASGIIGAAATASFGNNSSRLQLPGDFQGFSLQAPGVKSAFLADLFATLSFTAQHGNFQRLFLDLSRFHARLDFPSGSKLLSGATRLAQDFFNSQQPSMEALQAICPNTTLSFQQQIAGPFSFRVDSGVAVDLRNKRKIQVDEPVFAIEYALQVLGSAKAVAWYSPKHQEIMIELRFFET